MSAPRTQQRKIGPTKVSRSSDLADISKVVPMGVFGWANDGQGTSLHTWAITACGGMSIGDRASLDCARMLAGAGCDAMSDPDLRAAARADSEAGMADKANVPLLPTDRTEPIGVPNWLRRPRRTRSSRSIRPERRLQLRREAGTSTSSRTRALASDVLRWAMLSSRPVGPRRRRRPGGVMSCPRPTSTTRPRSMRWRTCRATVWRGGSDASARRRREIVPVAAGGSGSTPDMRSVRGTGVPLNGCDCDQQVNLAGVRPQAKGALHLAVEVEHRGGDVVHREALDTLKALGVDP